MRQGYLSSEHDLASLRNDIQKPAQWRHEQRLHAQPASRLGMFCNRLAYVKADPHQYSRFCGRKHFGSGSKQKQAIVPITWSNNRPAGERTVEMHQPQGCSKQVLFRDAQSTRTQMKTFDQQDCDGTLPKAGGSRASTPDIDIAQDTEAIRFAFERLHRSCQERFHHTAPRAEQDLRDLRL
jgi:hypothetical protein